MHSGYNQCWSAALEDPKLIPGAETPRCFVEQTSRRSCLDDSPLANAQAKDGQKQDMALANGGCKELQSKDLLPPLADPTAFPIPHEALPDSAVPFDGPVSGLKFEPSLGMPESSHVGANLDTPIIRLDGTSGMSPNPTFQCHDAHPKCHKSCS